jgi:hypothetical protein
MHSHGVREFRTRESSTTQLIFGRMNLAWDGVRNGNMQSMVPLGSPTGRKKHLRFTMDILQQKLAMQFFFPDIRWACCVYLLQACSRVPTNGVLA